MPAQFSRTLRFGSTTFKLAGSFKTKKAAVKRAQALRGKGNKCRVLARRTTSKGTRFLLYACPKSAPLPRVRVKARR